MNQTINSKIIETAPPEREREREREREQFANCYKEIV